MEVLYTHILPHLPLPLQEIVLNPPSFTDPQSFIPIIKLLLPYTKWILVLSAVYILWSFLSGIFGMFSRVLRFSMKIGPIIGLVAYLMNSSGQGSMDELFGLVKQYFGLAPQQAGGGWSPGIASLASLFTDQSGSTKNRKNKKNSWTGSGIGKGNDPISSRTRNQKNKKSTSGGENAGDIFENLVNQATNEENINAVQDFVKSSLAKAAGLDWLFGDSNKKEEDKSKNWKSR
ncbi:hypothetical protein L486_03473 [Kwoniella mangroviensis CBS 10435]|uniref:Uncharacterized protein n=1 Tax=Kwoniella mangroviensis CBS 10435 TaxID=1331196 RepID=A0A1B9ITW7_9TREE|nr:uncharacterized protein I203_02160 [Kwoniella mangroviensis CBS 8507]OCF58976.1 hypothetical protein L486_03473 [Kwoniella mangroviensis CBS 10435]OCF68770.1 hypothetical protein I203_02160 [Kwoniella mangroviensis CBS 8507]OCF76770.1 hypothetical protein I204_02472 [Kwoniella mangroviensis CBS 8886]